MADNHTIYKNGAKEIAHLNGCSITFMAKPDHTWIGNSCHIHSSLWRDGENAFAGESDVFKQYLAGQIACLKELAVFLAPTINSYKRYAAGSWAPTTLAWGHDNRTCGFRIVGHGAGLRAETRIPGGDVNPYLALRGAPRRRPPRDRARARAAAAARGKRLRVRRRALPPLAARGDRRARGGHDGARRARGRRRRPLPELRAHRAAALRRGRHLLRARAMFERGRRPVMSALARTGLTDASGDSRDQLGITTYRRGSRSRTAWGVWEAPAALDPAAYVQAVERPAGGRCSCPRATTAIEETLDALDGLLFSGGSDLDPGTYGADAPPRDERHRPERDRAEIALLQAALERDMPVLAVCRGSQVLNVARAATSSSTSPTSSGDEKHKHTPGRLRRPRRRRNHGHAAPADPRRPRAGQEPPPPGLRAARRGAPRVARADDGTIEALEDPSRRFALGVLWHPEEGEDFASSSRSSRRRGATAREAP